MRQTLLERYSRTEHFKRGADRLEEPGSRLGGFYGGSLALFLSVWRRVRAETSTNPTLVVTAYPEAADELVEELEFFFPGSSIHFPACEPIAPGESISEPEEWRQRLDVLDGLRARKLGGRFVVCPAVSLIEPVPRTEGLDAAEKLLKVGEEAAPEDLCELFVAQGYRRVALVEAPGEFSSRGDVLDVYSLATPLPVRLEFFDNMLDSVREFDPESQRSIAGSSHSTYRLRFPGLGELVASGPGGAGPTLLDVLEPSTVVVVSEPELVEEHARAAFLSASSESGTEACDRFLDRLADFLPRRVYTLPAPPDDRPAADLGFGSVETFSTREPHEIFGGFEEALAAGASIQVVCEGEAESRRFTELVRDHSLQLGPALEVVVGTLRRGFHVRPLDVVVLTTRELYRRRTVRRFRRRAAPRARPIDTFLELREGDHVVHVVHGIARYRGLETLQQDGVAQEFLCLEFRSEVKLYVPVSKIDLVQKYIGAGEHQPVLDRIGGAAWARKKAAVEEALLDLASELLELHAARGEKSGFAFPEDGEWQREFEAAFPFEETPDQVQVAAAIRRDMRSRRPMDRLVCGDVGYGKTELAMRAAFRAVEGGKQVAVLVPTTVLAEQHFRTFRERMAEFPVTIEVLSRFRTNAQQQDILKRAAAGATDILIGTHRLLSDDVVLRDLGLVIIDEEQRFGVLHKEKLKRMRREVDVLTLSATPIPRTLHMSLVGIRDISNLTTAPEGRSAIHTEISHFDRHKVRAAILHELSRDGQVYFVHNRVLDIRSVKSELESIVPEARIEFAHGQMAERKLEEKMMRFLDREIDVLVATTIIESGIDIPTVNTIFINEADRYGLADLHQLRGRVGRYKHQAYCFLLLPPQRHVSPEAQKRMSALVEYSGLGAGFQIAMRDLEIRGAGNILGKEQSGHIAAVGYDMYCRLLEKCVKRQSDEEYREPVHVEVDLVVEASMPESYAGSTSVKLETYRRIGSLCAREDVAAMAEELADRYGPLPAPVRRLLELQEFRLLCTEYGVEYVGRRDHNLILRGGERMQMLLEGCPRRVSVLDAATVAISLKDQGGRYGPELDDDRVFDLVWEWLESGTFPVRPGRRRRLGARGYAEERRPAGPVKEAIQ